MLSSPTTTRRSLGRILDHLGTTLLEKLAGSFRDHQVLGGVVIYDAADDLVIAERSIVLGVGVHDHDGICQLLREVGHRNAAALVVRAPMTVNASMERAVQRSGVTLLGLVEGASWTQLVAMLRTLLAEDDVGAAMTEFIGGMPSGDLFSLANAIAALLDAPLTIEDRNSNVLAFSGRQDEADPSRVETILGRRVPDRYVRSQESRGEFEQLRTSEEPVFLPGWTLDDDEHAMARVAIAVRAGEEILGSMWAAVREPLSDERNRAFADSAKLVALHMLRFRAGSDVERRLRADLVNTALEGGPSAPEAAGRLGLSGRPVAVLALGLNWSADGGGAADSAPIHAANLQRAADALALHLSALQPGSAVAVLGDRAYATVPLLGNPQDHAKRTHLMAQGFLDRTGQSLSVLIGIGPLAMDGGSLPNARHGADQALRVLRYEGGTRRVVTAEDVYIDSLLLDLTDLVTARGNEISRPIAQLLAYDAKHQAHLVKTLRYWLNAFGDVGIAAKQAYVHPSTFRYRIRRVSAVSGLDLTDPHQRFAAMMQLRLLELATAPQQDSADS